MLITKHKWQIRMFDKVFDVKMFVKQWKYVISTCKSGNEKISHWMAHRIVSLHETQKRDPLPHNVDHWKMFPENYWLEFEKSSIISHNCTFHINEVLINLPTAFNCTDWKDTKLLS